jgi:cell division protein FtsL
MIRRYGGGRTGRTIALFYFFILTIPVFLGLTAWQSVRYTELEKNARRLEAIQEDWIEKNKRLIAGIAVLSSSARIEQVALNDLGLSKVQPEHVLQIRIEGE